MQKYIAIDIGGTAIKYSLIDENAQIIEKKSMPTEASKGGEAIMEKVLRIVHKYKEGASGVCISSAGMVDIEKGEIFHSGPAIPNYAGTQFKKIVERASGLPCEIENDVNCAGLAESSIGAAKGTHSSVTLTIGTGIGGCAVLDGKVYHGFSGSACEVGYMIIGGDRNFEQQGAASVMTKRASDLRGEPVEQWNGYRVFEEAKKGDPCCNQAIDEMCDVLGKGIANLCYVLNPEMVVLGGGIMAQEDVLYPKIRASIDKYLIPTLAEKTELRMAKLQNTAGMTGAFFHFKQMQEIRKQRQEA